MNQNAVFRELSTLCKSLLEVLKENSVSNFLSHAFALNRSFRWVHMHSCKKCCSPAQMEHNVKKYIIHLMVADIMS